MLPGSHLPHENVPYAMEGQFFPMLVVVVSSVLGSFLQSSLKLKFSKPWHWSQVTDRPKIRVTISLIGTNIFLGNFLKFCAHFLPPLHCSLSGCRHLRKKDLSYKLRGELKFDANMQKNQNILQHFTTF